MCPAPIAQRPSCPLASQPLTVAVTLHPNENPLIEHSKLAVSTPIDATEVNQLAKFVFYCGYELMNSHPSLQAAAMLGRAGCGVFSVVETTLSASSSTRSLSSHRTDSSAHRSSQSLSDLGLPINGTDTNKEQGLNVNSDAQKNSLGPSVVASFRVDEPNEPLSPAQQALQLGKCMSVTGESTAALGYIAGVLQASGLSVALIDGGFGLLTLNCFLQSWEAWQKAEALSHGMDALSATMPQSPLLDSLKSHWAKQQSAQLCHMVCLAGYGAAFSVSYAAPYVALALFAPIIAADYGGKFVFKTVNHSPQALGEPDELKHIPEKVLLHILEYLRREQEIFASDSSEHTSATQVMKALLAHEHNREQLLTQLPTLTPGMLGALLPPQDEASSLDTDIERFRQALGLYFADDLPPFPQTLREALARGETIDFGARSCIARVEAFMAGSGSGRVQDTADALLHEDQDHTLLQGALAVLGLPVKGSQLQLAQLYDYAFKHFPVIQHARATWFDALASTYQAQLLSKMVDKPCPSEASRG